MGNRIVRVLLLLVATSFFLTENASAIECNDPSLKIPFNSLQYLDYDFGQRLKEGGGTCRVVKGVNNDADARKACGSNAAAINPGNPQYTDIKVGGDLSSNGTLDYYFCVQGRGKNFNKARMCNEMKSAHKELKVEFRKPTSNATDGNCMCGEKGSTKMVDCARSRSIPEIKYCEPLTAEWKEVKGETGCFCSDGSRANVVKESCGAHVKMELPTSITDLPEIKACGMGEVSEQVQQCIKRYESKILECKSTGEEATKLCDPKNNNNREIGLAQQIVSGIAQNYIAANKGSGSKTQCAAASLIGSGTFNILDQLKTKCDDKLAACDSVCDEIKVDLKDYCLKESPQPVDENCPSPDQKKIADESDKYKDLKVQAFATCKDEAPKNESMLHDTLLQADTAARSGAMCACQLSTTGQNCEVLGGPVDCKVNPNLPGCSGNATLSCVIGSGDYASAKCECLRNPTASICKTADGKIPPSFAGVDVKTGTMSGVDFFPGDGGSGAGSNFDLGSLSAEQKAAASKKEEEANPGFGPGSPGGGGGGALGGGGAAAGEDPAAVAGEATEKPSLGLLGQIKTTLGNLFGGGKGKNSGSGVGGLGKNKGLPNVDSWRPRGLASTGCKSSQVRCKNETIWDIMNHRYDEKNGTFLSRP